ncbi:hypothetical protein AX14_004970 [Amanita brunnescens Koide BX004]|nr:hypothetical protein AX14_004970 [Amanita brunnescens Koide BX004]
MDHNDYNNFNVSEANNARTSSRRSFDHPSAYDFQSSVKHRKPSLQLFIRPTIACSWQFIVLVMLIAFIIRTESTAYPTVPRYLATLYIQYPQDTTAAITLVGSLLSLISTKAFSEAVRFATVVSLRRSPSSKNMSLYSLHARITIGSGKTLLDFGISRVRWTIISLVSLLLFTVQTTAWTTILTPRATDIPYQTSFQDLDYAHTVPVKDYTFVFDMNWAPAWDNGYAAATEGTNMTQFLSFYGYVLNGTSRGIFPITPTFDNWTRVEAIQQGLTADVSCRATPASDPRIRIQETAVTPGINQVSFCCNCTSASTNYTGFLSRPLVYEPGAFPYLAFTICPISNADSDITVYMNNGNNALSWIGNQTCTITPRWLDVNVTYIRDGFVTAEPTTQNLPNIPLISSTLIQSAVSTLRDHFTNSQTMTENHIMNTITTLAESALPGGFENSQFDELVANYMVGTRYT